MNPLSIVAKIVKLVRKIKDAVEKVDHNKKLCSDIREKVETIGDILSVDNTKIMPSCMCRSPCNLSKALETALQCIKGCQEKSRVAHLLKADQMSKELQDAEQEIIKHLDIVHFAMSYLQPVPSKVILTPSPDTATEGERKKEDGKGARKEAQDDAEKRREYEDVDEKRDAERKKVPGKGMKHKETQNDGEKRREKEDVEEKRDAERKKENRKGKKNKETQEDGEKRREKKDVEEKRDAERKNENGKGKKNKEPQEDGEKRREKKDVEEKRDAERKKENRKGKKNKEMQEDGEKRREKKDVEEKRDAERKNENGKGKKNKEPQEDGEKRREKKDVEEKRDAEGKNENGKGKKNKETQGDGEKRKEKIDVEEKRDAERKNENGKVKKNKETQEDGEKRREKKDVEEKRDAERKNENGKVKKNKETQEDGEKRREKKDVEEKRDAERKNENGEGKKNKETQEDGEKRIEKKDVGGKGDDERKKENGKGKKNKETQEDGEMQKNKETQEDGKDSSVLKKGGERGVLFMFLKLQCFSAEGHGKGLVKKKKFNQDSDYIMYKVKLSNESNETRVHLHRIGLSGAASADAEHDIRVRGTAKLEHTNISELLGYFSHGGFFYMVEESFGSLSRRIYDNASKGNELSWQQSSDIILYIADGVVYLHDHGVIHMSLCPSKIGIGPKCVPKIYYSQISEITQSVQEGVHTSLRMERGFAPPEYERHGRFSVKTDVYSYGVLLLELITGQMCNQEGDDYSSLTAWVLQHALENNMIKCIHPRLVKAADGPQIEDIKRCIRIALLCVEKDPALRPTMHDVRGWLRNKKQDLPRISGNWKIQKPAYITERARIHFKNGFPTTYCM